MFEGELPGMQTKFNVPSVRQRNLTQMQRSPDVFRYPLSYPNPIYEAPYLRYYLGCQGTNMCNTVDMYQIADTQGQIAAINPKYSNSNSPKISYHTYIDLTSNTVQRHKFIHVCTYVNGVLTWDLNRPNASAVHDTRTFGGKSRKRVRKLTRRYNRKRT